MGNLHISGHPSLSRKLGCPHFWVSRGPGERDPAHSLVPSQMETPEGIQKEVGGKGKRLSGAPDRGAPPSAFSVRGGIWGEE